MEDLFWKVPWGEMKSDEPRRGHHLRPRMIEVFVFKGTETNVYTCSYLHVFTATQITEHEH